MPANPNNNTVATATSLLLSEGLPQTVSGSLGATDLLDFYKFSTPAASNLKLTLSGLTGNARLSVLAADGITAVNPGVASGNTSNISNDGKLSESFVFNALPAGNYVIKVDLGAVGGVVATAADYNLEAIANKDVTANSVLWKQATDGAPTIAWQLNGPNLAGDVLNTPAGYQFVGTGDFDGLSDAGGKSQDILWKKSLGNGSYELNIWFMNSDNSLRESKSVVLSGATTTTAFGVPDAFQIQRLEDFDGDGKTDILFRQTAANSVVLWKMDGATVNLTASQNYTRFDPAFEIFGTGDFDNNGIKDILFRNPTGGGGVVVVWLLDSALKLIEAPAGQTNGPSQSGLLKYLGTSPILTAEWKMLGVTDFNKTLGGVTTNPQADDKDDLLFLNQNTGQLVSWLMNGSEIKDGGFILNGAVISGTPGAFDFVGLGDLNGDGNGDMLWRPKSKTGALVAWQMEGKDINLAVSGLVALDSTPTAPFALSPAFEILTRNSVSGDRSLVDFDGNKRADIFLRDTGTGNTIVWSMNGKAVELAKSGATKNTDGTVPGVPTTFQVIGGLTAQLASLPQGTAGAALSTAFSMGTLEGVGNYQDTLIGTASDFFKFKLEKTSDVAVALSPAFNSTAAVTATFTLSLQTGLNPDGTPLLTPQTLTAGTSLAAGTYFLEVKKATGVGLTTTVNYNLKVTGEPSVINLKSLALTSVTASNANFQGTGGAIRLADLVGVTPQTPDSAKPKATIDISYQITNTEVKPAASVKVRFYLSRVSTINPADTKTVVLGDDTITTVPGNNAVTNKVFANVALPPGDNNFWTTDTNYYIGYAIDPVNPAVPGDQGAIQETFETANLAAGLTDNNVLTPPATAGALGTKTVAIQNTQTPDLLGVGLAAAGSTTVAKGGTIALNYTVRNGGKKATGSVASPPPIVSVRFYLYRPSTDPNLTIEQQTALDITDSTRTIALGATDDNALFLPSDIPGETTAAARPITLQLPGATSSFWTGVAPNTAFFIGMVVDSGETIAESNEINNLNLGLGQDRLVVTVA
jgi:Bacterial pre-peptidase C-terminal domain